MSDFSDFKNTVDKFDSNVAKSIQILRIQENDEEKKNEVLEKYKRVGEIVEGANGEVAKVLKALNNDKKNIKDSKKLISETGDLIHRLNERFRKINERKKILGGEEPSSELVQELKEANEALERKLQSQQGLITAQANKLSDNKDPKTNEEIENSVEKIIQPKLENFFETEKNNIENIPKVTSNKTTALALIDQRSKEQDKYLKEFGIWAENYLKKVANPSNIPALPDYSADTKQELSGFTIDQIKDIRSNFRRALNIIGKFNNDMKDIREPRTEIAKKIVNNIRKNTFRELPGIKRSLDAIVISDESLIYFMRGKRESFRIHGKDIKPFLQAPRDFEDALEYLKVSIKNLTKKNKGDIIEKIVDNRVEQTKVRKNKEKTQDDNEKRNFDIELDKLKKERDELDIQRITLEKDIKILEKY